jgi:hypothetical protein
MPSTPPPALNFQSTFPPPSALLTPETWPPPLSLRCHLLLHRFKPLTITDDIFVTQNVGHKVLGPNVSPSVGQSYKDFIFDSRETSLLRLKGYFRPL